MKLDRVAPASPLPSRPHLPGPAARGRAAPHSSFVEVLREGAARPGGPAAAARASPPAAAASGGAAAKEWLARGVSRTLAGAAAGEARLDAILDAAARGKTFTPGELLAMQATVFRYSQTVEVLSRATDRLVGAVKQTLGTQV
jgi:hypothetical protein